MRLAIGALAGLALISVSSGRFQRVRYDITRQTLAAGGIGVLYTVVFAATLYYHFLPELVGFILLTVVSAAAFVLALYHRRIAVSIMGALGAYATPILVDPGQSSLVMLFVYLLIVNARNLSGDKTPGFIHPSVDRNRRYLGVPDVCIVFRREHGRAVHHRLGVGRQPAFFTVIIDLTKLPPDQSVAVSSAGNILYLSVTLLSFILLRHPNETSYCSARQRP